MKRSKRLRNRAGFSLVELIVSLVIFSIIMGSLISVILVVQRRYVDQRERVRAQESLRVAQMTIAPLLRAAGADPRESKLTLVNVDPDGNGVFDDLRVVSDFNPIDGDVADDLEDVQIWVATDTLWIRWKTGAAKQALAWPIKSLRFEYYANNGTKYTDAIQTVGATRARFILESPRDVRTNQLERTEAWWVNLRNRQGL
jgi:prepilin-type N-terminal cleavage/methylation domain-containing protein